jgi:exosortase C (VPDSG-CTERM-specific)
VNRSQRTQTAAIVLYAAAIMFIFGAPLAQLFNYARHDDVNSYVVLVPFVCAYLLWIRRSTLANQFQAAHWPGAGLLVIAAILGGIAMHFRPTPWMPAESDRLTLSTFSFVLLVWAGGFFFLGRDWMRSAAFPVCFLIFVVPLPSALVGLLENASKVASAEAANLFFSISGTPTLRNGNVFLLPGITIEVAQECSGIRSTYVLILTALLAGNLFLIKTWSRIVLVCLVIPLGIIRNGFRVWTIATLCIHFGPQMIHSVIHRRGGPAFFALSLIALMLFVGWLRILEQRRRTTVQENSTTIGSVTALRPVAASRIGKDDRNG